MTAQDRTPQSVLRIRYTALVIAGGLLVVAGALLVWPPLGLILGGIGLAAFGLLSLGLEGGRG